MAVTTSRANERPAEATRKLQRPAISKRTHRFINIETAGSLLDFAARGRYRLAGHMRRISVDRPRPVPLADPTDPRNLMAFEPWWPGE